LKKTKRLRLLIIAALLIQLLVLSVGAQSRVVTTDLQFCFSTSDFTANPEADGVFITAVPSPSIARVLYGDRVIRAGDALPVAALGQLTLQPLCVTPQEVTLSYYTVSQGRTVGANELKLSILPKKNEPPAADAGRLETYKNIPNSGQLSAADPEGGRLTFQLVKEPKRGTVELEADGSYTYTPFENKVGKDSFTFTATDEAGNISDPAKVSILIRKPTDQTTYADMEGDEDVYAAMWMKDAGLYTGSVVGDNLCFAPEECVSRGEFLVMVMKLVEAEPDEAVMSTGFADEQAAPVWMQPYISAALSNGMISGTLREDGVVFRPMDTLTEAEAVVMLQNILQLPAPDAEAVFAQEDKTIPVWAQSAVSALNQADIHVRSTREDQILSRRDAAQVLLQINGYLAKETPVFYWTK